MDGEADYACYLSSWNHNMEPDIQAIDEVKVLMLESVNVWKNYRKWMLLSSSTGATRPSRRAQGRSNVYTQLSGLEDVGFNGFNKNFFIPEGDGQVTSGSVAGQFAV